MSQKEPDFTYKILLLGDGFVGKTSLVRRYISNTFTKTYIHTIGMQPSFRNEKISGKNVRLQIFDIAGQESIKSLRPIFYRGARGGLITFDLTRKETFENVKNWINEVNKKTQGGKYILIGNKSDLTKQRVVAKEEGTNLAKKLNLIDYIETSALTGDKVSDAFKSLADLILNDQLKR